MKFTLLLILAFMAISPLAQYTPADNAGVVISQNWLNMEWSNSTKTEYTYDTDPDGNCRIQMLYIYVWNTQQSDWSPESRTTFSYNDDGLIDEAVTEIIDSNNEWLPYLMDTYTYLGSGSIDQVFHSVYESGWVENNKETYTYTTSGLVETVHYEYWDWINSVWLNNMFETHLYDLSDALLSVELDIWTEVLQDWQSITKTEYLYDGNTTTENYFLFSDGDWLLNARKMIAYNAYDKVQSEVSELWQSDLQVWIENQNIQYTYDDLSGLLLSRTVNMIVDQSEELGPLFQSLYSDHCVNVGISEIVNEMGSLLVIGNPSDLLRVLIHTIPGTANEIQLYDLQGNRIMNYVTYSHPGQITEIPVGELASGTYLVTTKSSGLDKAVRWIKK